MAEIELFYVKHVEYDILLLFGNILCFFFHLKKGKNTHFSLKMA